MGVAWESATSVAAAATGARSENLEVEVAVADVVVAVAVFATTTTTPTCLEVTVPHGCAEETEAKAEATNPGGRCGCFHEVHGFDPVVHRYLLTDVLRMSSISTK